MAYLFATGKRSSATWLFLAFAAVVASFLAANIIVQRSSAEVSALSEQIIRNSAPSIERLAAARRSVLEAELALSRLIREPVVRPDTQRTIATALDRAAADTAQYVALPAFAGEQELVRDVQQSWLDFEAAVRRAEELAESKETARASSVFVEAVEPARRRLLDNVIRAIELNAGSGRQLAVKIRQARERSDRLANGLDGICTLLAVLMAFLLFRQTRNRRGLLEAYTRSVEARAEELEQFSGRVAHDIRSPLAAARLGAELVRQRASDEKIADLATRIMGTLSRAEAITTALLDFARSGAKPDPGARTDPRVVLVDAMSGLVPHAERAHVELRFDPVPPVLVACGTGVYLSLVGNLVNNAVKYMGNATTRRIRVGVTDRGSFVRTEVADTGPGIQAESLPVLFEPYFRAQRGGADGLGLGLATVKKLAEAHGGAVGVSSVVGQGSTFWFDLPRAGAANAAMADAGEDAAAEPIDLPH